MQLTPSFFALAIALGSLSIVEGAPIKVTRDIDPSLGGLFTSTSSTGSAHAVANVHSNGNRHSASASLCIGGILSQVNGQYHCSKSKGSYQQTTPSAPKPAPKPISKPAIKPVVNKKPSSKKTVKTPVHAPHQNKPVTQHKVQPASNAKAAPKPSLPVKATDASAHGGNGGFASGGSAACNTGNNLIGLSALNINSCNGGQGGNAPGGNAIGGHTGSMTLLGRQAGIPQVINNVLSTFGLRRRNYTPDGDDKMPTGAPSSDGKISTPTGPSGKTPSPPVPRDMSPEMEEAKHAHDSVKTTDDEEEAAGEDGAGKAQDLHARQDGTPFSHPHRQESQAIISPDEVQDYSNQLQAREDVGTIPSDAYLDDADDDADMEDDETMTPPMMQNRQMEEFDEAKDAAASEAGNDEGHVPSKMTSRQDKTDAAQGVTDGLFQSFDDAAVSKGNATMTKSS